MKTILGLGFSFSLLCWGMLTGPIQVLGWDFDHLPGDAVDTRFNLFILEHGYRYWQGFESSFWNVRIFYPARLVTAYSDAHLGNLPAYVVLRQIGCSPERSLQVWWLGCYVANYLSTMLMLRRYGTSWLAAGCGAYLFAFSLATFTLTVQHVQLAPRYFVPWILLLGYEWIWKPKSVKLLVVTVLVVLQTYTTIYIGYLACLVLLIQSVVVVGFARRSVPWREHRESLIRVLCCVIAGFGLLLPLFLPYILVSPDRGHFSPGFLKYFLPSIGSWLSPCGVSVHTTWLRNWNADMPTRHELELFPGVVVVLALAATIVSIRQQSQSTKIWISTIICIGILTLRIEGCSLYTPLYYLPAIKGVQAVSRVVLVMLVPMALVVATCIDQFKESMLVRIAIVLLLVVDHSYSGITKEPRWIDYRFSRQYVIQRQSMIKQRIQQHQQPTIVYIYPVFPDDELESRRLRLDAMLACQELGLACVNGWSGSTPLTYSQFEEREDIMNWLTVENRIPDGEITGLVILGLPRSAQR